MISFRCMQDTVTPGLIVWRRNSESTTWWRTYKKYINYSANCIHLKEMTISSVFPSSPVCPENVLLTGDTQYYQCKCMIHEISSWSLSCWDTAMTGIKVIFHLRNIIQLICWVHTCHTVCCIYTYNLSWA